LQGALAHDLPDDTLRPLWFPAFCAGPFGVFLLRQFFMTIPNDLEDAAKIDGCSLFGIYWRIMLPLIKPALAALVIMSFIGAWSNFMGPLIYCSSPEMMPLAYALALFAGQHGGEQSLMMAASTMVMLPVLLVFFFTQRYFIQGVTLTGMGGR
jgi:multiple sugar transport system permease protein